MLNMKVWIATFTSWMGVSFTVCVLVGVVVPGHCSWRNIAISLIVGAAAL